MKTGLNGAAHEYVCFGGAGAGGSRNTYAADGSGLLRGEVPVAERGTPTTTRGGRVGTLELEIGLTTL